MENQQVLIYFFNYKLRVVKSYIFLFIFYFFKGYVGTTSYKSNQIGIMFLNEVALGKEHPIYRDDPSLVKPPNGFDSVVAQGVTEPGK